MSAKQRRAARAARDLSMYPKVFFDVVAKHHAGEAIPQLRQPDGGEHGAASIARANQKLFSKFRKALMANGHTHAISACDLICRVINVSAVGQRGTYYLEFVPRGLAILADELRPSRGGNLLTGERGAPSPLRGDQSQYEEPHIPGLDKPTEQEEKQQLLDKPDEFRDEMEKFWGKTNTQDIKKPGEDK